MPYFIQRPNVTSAIKWTGDNLQEIEDWAEENEPSIVGRLQVDENNVLTVSNTMSVPCYPGDWMTQFGTISNDEVQRNMQEVAFPEVNYNVTQRTT